MVITMICEVLGDPNNGTTISALNLANYLKSQGHEVRIVCPDKDKEGIPGYYVLPQIYINKFADSIFKKNKVVLAQFDSDVLDKAIEGADVVHFMIALHFSRKACKYVKSKGYPVTGGFHAQAENVSSHFGFLNSKFVNKIIYRWLDGNVFSMADAIHYPTQFIRDVFEENVHRKTNGYVISNGVNKIFTPGEIVKDDNQKDKFSILTIGRLSKEKDHMTLLKAMKYSKYADKIQLYFAGQGPLYNKIVNYSKKHLINQPIISFYNREELIERIRSCDLYCHPAIAEIEAISCLEAISCGLVPLISNSDRSATKAFALDERSLFEVNDPKDLAKKIDYFIEHPQETKKLQQLYLQEAQNFDQLSCMKQMEKMFFDVVKEHKSLQNKN